MLSKFKIFIINKNTYTNIYKYYTPIIFFSSLIFLSSLFFSNSSFSEHPDEYKVIGTAINISQGNLNPNFYRYPSGQMYILASIFYISDFFYDSLAKEDYFNISRTFSRICVAGIVTLVFLVCALSINLIAGLASSIFTLSCISIRSLSSFAIPDVPMSFFIILFIFITSIFYKKIKYQHRALVFSGIVTGIAISMKYTAALLLPCLIILSISYIEKKHIIGYPVNFIRKLFMRFGLLLLLSVILIKTNYNKIMDYFLTLTTDNIIEIEYIRFFNIFTYLTLVLGLVLVYLSYTKIHSIQNLYYKIFHPLNLKLVLITFISFTLFSPYSIIELKKSFSDFMYELRHMKIGSAAHYHYLSDKHLNFNALNTLEIMQYYMKIFYNNFDIIGAIMLPYGIVTSIFSKKPYPITFLIFFSLYLTTILSWQNIAIRYSFCLIPLAVIFITHGVDHLSEKIAQKFYLRYNMVLILFSIIISFNQL